MKLRTCDYCGTEYDMKQLRCPSCGSKFHDGTPDEKRMSGGTRMAPKGKRDPDRIPRWLWACICAVLGLAVLIGMVAFVLCMGYFEEGFDLNAIPTNVVQTEQLPVEDEAYPYEQEEELNETEEVDDGACTALELSQEEIILTEVDEKFFLSAAASPSDCTDEIIYESEDESIAVVGENGMVTAVAPGTTNIVVTCGDITSVCIVVCDFELEPAEEETEPEQEEDPAPEEEVPAPVPTVTPDDFTLFYPGEEAYLNVENAPEGAAISYVSSNAAVVTVTDKGKVTAVGNGQATITVMVGDVKLTSIARCNLNSTTEGEATPSTQNYTGPFALNYSDVTLQFVGEKLNLKLTDSTGKTVSGLSWVTGNGSVCTVSDGVVTALGSGETKVSCTYNGTTYSCIIRTAF